MNLIAQAAKLSRYSLLLLVFMTLSWTANAQKFAVVDINKVLENMPEYETAQTEIDRLADLWRQEIAQEYDQIKGLYNKYQAEQVLLSDDARRQREEEIMDKEKQVRDLQRMRFGPEGELFQKRQELVRPIQDRIYEIVEDYANDRGYDFIFDKGGDLGIIFANPLYDKTEDILDRLK